MTSRRSAGFTLVELLIVVAIISVLAVVAGTAYRRYMDQGRMTEVFATFGEFRLKQEAYKAEFSQYLTWSTAENVYFPALLGVGNEPRAKDVIVGTTDNRPAAWKTLGVNPQKRQYYCGYAMLAGNGGTAPTGTRGKDIFNNVTPTAAWWYAVGTCDNDGDGQANHNAYFVTSSATTTVFDENKTW